MRLFLAVALPLLATACATRGPSLAARQGLEPGTLVTGGGDPVPLATWAQAAAGARYVLIGEGHDQACDHRTQAQLVAALASSGPVVGLEMVSTERQPVLDRFASGEVTVAELGDALAWQEKWGVPFDMYRPIFEAAQVSGLPVAALNLPADQVRKVSREGVEALPPEIPALIPPPPGQEAFLRETFEAHTHGEPTEYAFERFVRVQSLWDTAMARAAQTWNERTGKPVVVLAGAGHVMHGWGIAHRLRQLDPGAAITLVVPWRGTADIDPAEADFFFYCPAEERVTPQPAPRPAARGSDSPPAP